MFSFHSNLLSPLTKIISGNHLALLGNMEFQLIIAFAELAFPDEIYNRFHPDAYQPKMTENKILGVIRLN